MNRTIFKIILLPITVMILASFLLSQVAQADDNTKLTTGIFYIDGQGETLNSDNVTATSIPLLLSVKKDKLSFGVSMSYLTVKSSDLNEQGLGDTVLSVGFDLDPNFTLKLKEKVATGDVNKGLSTGKNDTSVQLDYFANANNNMSFFGTVGYKFVGKSNDFNMQDSPYASIGTGRMFNSKTNLGVSLDYKKSIFKNLDDQLGVAAFIRTPINETYSLSGFAGYDSTQTKSIGVSLTTKF